MKKFITSKKIFYLTLVPPLLWLIKMYVEYSDGQKTGTIQCGTIFSGHYCRNFFDYLSGFGGGMEQLLMLGVFMLSLAFFSLIYAIFNKKKKSAILLILIFILLLLDNTVIHVISVTAVINDIISVTAVISGILLIPESIYLLISKK